MTIAQNDKFVYFTLRTAKEMYSFSNAVMEDSEYNMPFMCMLEAASERGFKPTVQIDYLEEGNNIVAKAYCYDAEKYSKFDRLFGYERQAFYKCERTVDLLINWINLKS